MGSNLVLQGAAPRFIDEWQVVPEIWDLIKKEVDNKGRNKNKGLDRKTVAAHITTLISLILVFAASFYLSSFELTRFTRIAA